MARHVEDDYRARTLLDAEPDRPVKVMTLVRDPIERNISVGFARSRRQGGLEELRRYVTDPAVTDRIWQKLDMSLSFHWFDVEFHDALGIDTYQVDVASAGYGQMEVGRVNGLTFQSTSPHEVKSKKSNSTLLCVWSACANGIGRT